MLTYIDSSVALAYLLAKIRMPAAEFWRSALTSSRLLQYEVWNRIQTRQLDRSRHDEAVNGHDPETTRVFCHGDGGRHAAGFKGSRWIQALVFDEDVGIFAAREQGSEALAERDGLFVGSKFRENFGVTPHAGHSA